MKDAEQENENKNRNYYTTDPDYPRMLTSKARPIDGIDEDEQEETVVDDTFHPQLQPLRPDVRSSQRFDQIMAWLDQKKVNGWILTNKHKDDTNYNAPLPTMGRHNSMNVKRYIYWLNVYNNRALLRFNPDSRVVDDCGMNNFVNAWEHWYPKNYPELAQDRSKTLFYSGTFITLTDEELAWKKKFSKQPRNYKDNDRFTYELCGFAPSRYIPLAEDVGVANIARPSKMIKLMHCILLNDISTILDQDDKALEIAAKQLPNRRKK